VRGQFPDGTCLLLSLDEGWWQLGAIVSGHRLVLVLGRLVVVQPILPMISDVIHRVNRSDPPVQLTASPVSELERCLALS
jgi:hypothetical protein